MTEVAGEVGDGLLVHGFSTERYMREVTLPALERGAAKAGKTRADLTVSYPGFVVTGATTADMDAASQGRARADRLLRLHPGLSAGARAPRLGRPADRAQHPLQAGRVGEDGRAHRRRVLDAFAVVAPIDEVAAQVKARFGDIVDRFSFYTPYKMEPRSGGRCWRGFVKPVAGAPGPRGVADVDGGVRRRRSPGGAGARPPASVLARQGLHHLGRGQGRQLGVRFGDLGAHFDLVPQLSVDLDHHGHRLLPGRARDRTWANVGGAPTARRGGAAPRSPP